jgi:hypothetical protein
MTALRRLSLTGLALVALAAGSMALVYLAARATGDVSARDLQPVIVPPGPVGAGIMLPGSGPTPEPSAEPPTPPTVVAIAEPAPAPFVDEEIIDRSDRRSDDRGDRDDRDDRLARRLDLFPGKGKGLAKHGFAGRLDTDGSVAYGWRTTYAHANGGHPGNGHAYGHAYGHDDDGHGSHGRALGHAKKKSR